MFYQWFIENEYVNLPGKKIRNIRIPQVYPMAKVHSDLLTPEEAVARVTAAEKSRDPAIIVAPSGGVPDRRARAAQVVRCQLCLLRCCRQRQFENRQTRDIRIVMSGEFLAQWKK